MSFIKENFMLRNSWAEELFSYCRDLPIFDYHCHLSPEEIYKDEVFSDIYQVWLKGDHYKWRLMRMSGVDEQVITGDNLDPKECFIQYVKALEKAIDNPLYHWSHLELLRCFNIDETIKTENAEIIWNKANKYIKDNKYSPRKAVEQFNVHTIVTTDEVFSDLYYHKKISEDKSFKTRVLPSFRGDKLVNLDLDAIAKLGAVTGGAIKNLKDMTDRIFIQLNRFDELGAIVADTAFEGFEFNPYSLEQAEEVFEKALNKEVIASEEMSGYQTYMLLFLLREYYKRDWAVLLHIGAKRNNNTAIFRRLGADKGCDSVSDKSYNDGVNKLLDTLYNEGVLGRTIMFNLNPIDNYIVATTLGNFGGGKAAMQMGISWWFVDNKYGIIRMMQDYASLGNLGLFIGMLTDSRSFISYTRHEYFRRILSNHIAALVEEGEYPEDKDLLKGIVQGVSFNNAIKYFKN